MQVFISYAEPDESIAKRVAHGLEKENFKVWYDAEVLPGQDWAGEVSKALRESRAMVVLLTPGGTAFYEGPAGNPVRAWR